MDGPVGRLGVHPLAEEAEVLHLLADEAARHADLLAADDDHLLAIQQLLRYDRREAAQHVVARVHHDALRAHAGTGDHGGLTCEAAAALGWEWLGERVKWRREVLGFLIYRDQGSGFVNGPGRGNVSL